MGYRATFIYSSDALSPTAHSLTEGGYTTPPFITKVILSQKYKFVNTRAKNKIIDFKREKIYNFNI